MNRQNKAPDFPDIRNILDCAPDDLNQLADIAGDSAMYLLDDGLDFLDGFVAANDLSKLTAAQAVLVVGFALIKQRELHYEEQHAARPAGNQNGATDEQRQHDYDWLKQLVEKAMPNMSEAEHSDAIARIVRLAGV